MSAAYTPMSLVHKDTPWSWAEINKEASEQLDTTVDVRMALINSLAPLFPNASQIPALQPGNDPLIDKYDTLLLRAGADADSPTTIDVNADDQPFPFYGRVRVAWK